MDVMTRLERMFGRLAVPHLMRYIVALNALVYILLLTNRGYEQILMLNPAAVLSGEVWRLVSWIFLPNTSSPLWILFYLMFTWWVGDALESIWGTFGLNLYYFVGYLCCTAAAFAFGTSAGNFLLVLSLLLALATLAPDEQVLLLFFPVKLKWVAVLNLAMWGVLFVTGPLAIKAMILLCLGNYFLFFGKRIAGLIDRTSRPIRTVRKFAPSSPLETLHRCSVCGITEVSNPEADFRVAADGTEYCTDHLPPPAGR